MLFPTFDFLLFIIPVLLLSWAFSHAPAVRIPLLIAASYFFYMGGPKTDPLPAPWYFAGLLVLSTFLDYIASSRIHALSGDLESDDPEVVKRATRRRNAWLGLSLVGNLGLLGYFKYTNFLFSAFADIAGAFGLEVVVPHLKLILPVGISFYTFQTLSYTIDVWRRRLTPEPSFSKFALFVVFFPQLVAGPIVRASELLPQFHRRPQLSADNLTYGLFRIFKGLCKKVILGDWIAASFTDAVFAGPSTYTSLEILLALYAFTLQLYADFAGYSDIAIGIGKMLGYELPENFDRPYQARTLGEFWRRWHMTLSTWLRDYLFFPLGGSRGAPGRTYFNIWLTMFLVGMWHGASWNFVIYSNIHALAMVYNRWNRLRRRGPLTPARLALWAAGLGVFAGIVYLFGIHVIGLPDVSAQLMAGSGLLLFALVSWLPESGTPLNTALHVLLTFHFTVLSRVFFRADDLEVSRQMIAGILAFDGRGLRDGLLTPWMWLVFIGGLAYHFTPRRWVDELGYAIWRRLPGVLLGIMFAALCLGLMKLMSGAPKAFIYFQF
ncbi:MAG: MBOAT family protein [Myxococcales bacterium]|nr:MBOAT family protein [Myxococcales bacterium]MCB9707041.1 MBOAT family protein [Myxococcales bacterium]